MTSQTQPKTIHLHNTDAVIDRLLHSEHPAIRYKVNVNVLGLDPASTRAKKLQAEIANAPMTRQLLQHQRADGWVKPPAHVYDKWQGAHWVAAALADLGYPSATRQLRGLRNQLQQNWLKDSFFEEFSAQTKAAAYRHKGVAVMQGRHRRCASQQANALWSILKLGVANKQTHQFVERLLHWQWPDGGWNCDKNPDANQSSFMESLLPLRALALYAQTFPGNDLVTDSVERAKEVFLQRHLFQRRTDGSVIKQEFTLLHYPLYWHYDILHGLKVLAEAGFVADSRCQPALQLLADKQLPDGGWPAEKKYYRPCDDLGHGNDFVNWGPTGKTRMNPWVTADALFVFRTAAYLHL